jgi:hypothetical protein
MVNGMVRGAALVRVRRQRRHGGRKPMPDPDSRRRRPLVPDRLGAEAGRRAVGVDTRVQLHHPVRLHHRSRELEERLDTRAAVRLDVQPDTDRKGRGRTYLRVSWVRPATGAVDLTAARAGGVVEST